MAPQPLGWAALASALTLAGGMFRLQGRALPARPASWLVAFAAGLLLAGVLLGALAVGWDQAGGRELMAVGAGFLVSYLLDRTVVIHTCHEDPHPSQKADALSLAGLAFEAAVDGAAVAAAWRLQPGLGGAIALGVLAHRLATGFSLGGILRQAGWGRPRAIVALGAVAVATLVGAVVVLAVPATPVALALLLAACGGTFLYLATADLLPEAHRNLRDYGVPFAFVLGFGAILILQFR